MSYRERPSAVPAVVLWRRLVGPEPRTVRILPDGCLDLLWDGRGLRVAGPDTVAREHVSPAGTRYVALRFAAGTGSALLGVAAGELRNQTVDLAALWPAQDLRVLSEQVAADPAVALESWALRRAATSRIDPVGPKVQALAAAGLPVSDIADRLGLSGRQLHRRCVHLFGYGPRRLTRILRLVRALEQGRILEHGRSGLSLGELASECGYADQAHLSRDVRELTGTTPTRLLLGR